MAERKSKIRVCFIAPKAYPLFNPAITTVFGGAEVDLYLLATELARDANFAVSFITADYGQAAVENYGGVQVLKSLDFRGNALAGAWRVWQALRRADADVYLLETASWGVVLALLFCKRYRRRMVYRTAAAGEANGNYRRRHPWLGVAFDWVLRRADIVLAQNEEDRENLERRLGLEALVIPNGHVIPAEVERRRETILWVGRSDPIKRPKEFIDLAQKFPKERFTMICQRATGDDDYEELKATAGKVKNLEFIARVPFAEVEFYFQQAKVLVNTSWTEGFPNTFVQAAKCGAAILSLAVNPDGFLEKYDCGRACGGDFDRLISSLGELITENRFSKYGENGRKYAAERHDIINIVEEYKFFFRKLRAHNKRREKEKIV